MCELAFIGARAEGFKLISMLGGPHQELDVEVVHDPRVRSAFPDSDTVVRVTTNGCSCSLLKGLGTRGQAREDAHVAGAGYAFRRGIAAAVVAFGGARLVIMRNGEPVAEETRLASLRNFLRFGVTPADELVAIVP